MGNYNSLSDLVCNALRLAQVGECTAARDLASQARLEWRTEDSVSVTFDLMMVDGICSNYSGDLASAFDRFNRACALALMLKSNHRIHFSKAWLATVAFNLGRLTEAEYFLSSAAQYDRDVGSNALFRSAAVVCVLLQLCGDDMAARGWIKFAQRAASVFGHPGLMSHLLYNISAARISVRSLGRFFNDIPATNVELDSLAVDSSINFDAMSGTFVQSAFHPLIQAQSLGICGDFSTAHAKLDSFLADCKHVPSEFVVQAQFERLYARYRLEVFISTDELHSVESMVSLFKSHDDLASAYFILYLCFAKYSTNEEGEKYLILASKHREFHFHQCESILNGLNRSKLVGVPKAWWNSLKVS